MKKNAVLLDMFRISGFMAVLLLIAVSVTFAGAWTAPKGQTYNRLAMNLYSADEIFDNNGDTEPMADNGDFSDMNFSYYMEHGIIDELTLVFSTSYKYLESEDDGQESDNYSFSDIDLGLRYRLLQGKFGVLSVQGLVKIPEAYGDDEDIAPGNGQYDATLKLMYGRSLYPVIPGYFNFEAGYKYRDEEPADELICLVEFGVDITKKLYGRIKYDAVIGQENADNGSTAASNPSFAPDYDLAKVDLAFGYKLNKTWAVEIEALKEVSGKSVSKGTTFTAAVAFTL